MTAAVALVELSNNSLAAVSGTSSSSFASSTSSSCHIAGQNRAAVHLRSLDKGAAGAGVSSQPQSKAPSAACGRPSCTILTECAGRSSYPPAEFVQVKPTALTLQQ